MTKCSMYFLLLNTAFTFLLVVATNTADHSEEYSTEQHGHGHPGKNKRNHSAPAAVMSDHKRKDHEGHSEKDKRNHSAPTGKFNTKKILMTGAKFAAKKAVPFVLEEGFKLLVPGQSVVRAGVISESLVQ